MVLTVLGIWSVALVLGGFGFIVARQDRRLGAAVVVAMLGLAVWQLSAFASPMAATFLLVPGAPIALYSLLAGYLVAVGLTLVGLRRARTVTP